MYVIEDVVFVGAFELLIGNNHIVNIYSYRAEVEQYVSQIV